MTRKSQLGLATLVMMAILDFLICLSQSFKELESWNFELKVIILIYITGSYIRTMVAILKLRGPSLIYLNIHISVIQNFRYLLLYLLLAAILNRGSHLVTLGAIINSFKYLYLRLLKIYRAKIQNPS